jgi:hypothetical protein
MGCFQSPEATSADVHLENDDYLGSDISTPRRIADLQLVVCMVYRLMC